MDKMEKINLENKTDILKFSFTQLKNTKLYNFSGNFYKELFAEAMRLEKEEKAEIIIKEIEFEVTYRVEFGQRVVMVGNINEFGNWDVKKSYNLTWTTGDIWQGKIKFVPNFEFKFAVMVKEAAIRWEAAENRFFNFNDLKEIMTKCKNNKNVSLCPGMSASYEYASKVLTISCVWR